MTVLLHDEIADTRSESALATLLAPYLEPLPDFDRDDEFGSLFDRFGDASVILLGEATHGTSEFYRARASITRRLIEKHGFNVVAVEADWPDAARIDGYVRHHEPRPRRGDPFVRFPTWMWRNREVLEFAEWLRGHNEGLADAQQTSFHGLDVYSLAESMHAVIDYLERVDPAAASRARERYARLLTWQDDPAEYGRAVLRGEAVACEAAVVEQLKEMLQERLRWIADDGDTWFDAAQNARIVRSAESYYRTMYRGATESWNLRDRHMFDTLKAVLTYRGFGTKAVIWAHNSHVGNAAATSMGWQGQFNIGELSRLAFGDDAVLIGLGTDTGTVAAATEWGGEFQSQTVRPARPGSYEQVFRLTEVPRSMADWRGHSRRGLKGLLDGPLLERAIGVVYRPQTEYLSHYFQAALSDQFDCWLWFEKTHAVTPLGHERPHGAPETYPFGL